jgi:serine protease
VDVAVILQVPQPAAEPVFPDAGRLYVLLVDPAIFEVVDQVEVGPSGGIYPYFFSAVHKGIYQIWAGSDSNNDGYICDRGESCGAYLTLDQPVNLDVTDSRAALDFSATFIQGLAGQTQEASALPEPLPRPIRLRSVAKE